MAERQRHFDREEVVRSMDSLEEITGWLGTFRERLRIARESDRPTYEAMLSRLEARYRERRAELA